MEFYLRFRLFPGLETTSNFLSTSSPSFPGDDHTDPGQFRKQFRGELNHLQSHWSLLWLGGSFFFAWSKFAVFCTSWLSIQLDFIDIWHWDWIEYQKFWLKSRLVRNRRWRHVSNVGHRVRKEFRTDLPVGIFQRSKPKRQRTGWSSRWSIQSAMKRFKFEFNLITRITFPL